MKKLIIALVALIFSTGAMAQFHHGGHFGGGFYGPRVGVSVGYPYYGPYYPYSYGYYPYGSGYGAYYVPTKLDLKIEEINNTYDYKLSLVRHDKALTHQAKRAEKKALKYERNQAINQAKQDYYKSLQ